MRTSTRALSVPLVLACIAACSAGDGWTGTVSDSAGVTIVANTGRGMGEEGKAWTLEEELHIGTIAGDVEYQFGQIGGIAVDSRDRIFVLDAQARDVRVFSSDGTYQQTIGRPVRARVNSAHSLVHCSSAPVIRYSFRI